MVVDDDDDDSDVGGGSAVGHQYKFYVWFYILFLK